MLTPAAMVYERRRKLTATASGPRTNSSPTSRSHSNDVRVDIDLDLCQGHSMCEVEAPNNFHVPHRGKVELITPILPEDDRTAVEQAVWACPTRALTIKEDH